VHYPSSGHPQYLIDDFEEKNLTTWALKTHLNESFPLQNAENSNLLDHMIHEGKKNYLLSLSLPEKKESDILSFSKDEHEWCKDNEREIWLYFVERNLVYESDQNIFIKFITDGPNTNGMPAESPGNIGSWIGLQIIKNYMKNNPKKSIQSLFLDSLKSSQFLIKSNYKP
jgi:hypothetical protein